MQQDLAKFVLPGTTSQRVRFGILCALGALRGEQDSWAIEWRRWAKGWLSGQDIGQEAADRVVKIIEAKISDGVTDNPAFAAGWAAWAARRAARTITVAEAGAKLLKATRKEPYGLPELEAEVAPLIPDLVDWGETMTGLDATRAVFAATRAARVAGRPLDLLRLARKARRGG